MLGYSRTVSRLNDTRPTSTTTRLRTVAKTGRRMHRSDKPIGQSAFAMLARTAVPSRSFNAPSVMTTASGVQTFDDLDCAAAALTDLDLGQVRLPFHDLEHEVVLPHRHQRCLG